MDASEIVDLIGALRNLGNDTLTCEVKKAYGGLPAGIWETVSAFANAAGGASCWVSTKRAASR